MAEEESKDAINTTTDTNVPINTTLKAEVTTETPVSTETQEAAKVESQTPTTEAPHERYYTPTEVAREFNYSVAWINKLLRDKIIKAHTPTGTRWRIPASEVERMRKESIRTMTRKKPELGRTVSEVTVTKEIEEKVLPKPKGEKPKDKSDKKEGLGWPLNIFIEEEEE